jgi:hypothetical protein
LGHVDSPDDLPTHDVTELEGMISR